MGFADFFSKGAGSGYRIMKPNGSAKKYSFSDLFQTEKPPLKVDLRKFMTQVENQGDTNSCTANAVAGACEYLINRKMPERVYDISRMFIYYNSRKRMGGQLEDEGAVIQYAVESLKDFGACPETIWPFKKSIVNKKPNDEAFTLGQRFKMKALESVPIELAAWKKVLSEGYPIIFGTELYESFDDCCENGGFVSMPSPKDVGRAEHGGHAMLCVGYSEPDQVFIVRNSWGEDWGDKGYCYMPYNYLINEKLTGDCWVVKSDYAIENPKDTWDHTDKSISNQKHNVQVYNPNDYTHRKDFYDRDDSEILDYNPDLPADYAEVVEEFFDEVANLFDWAKDDLDQYSYDDSEEEEDYEDDDSEEEEDYEDDDSEEEEDYEDDDSEEEEDYEDDDSEEEEDYEDDDSEEEEDYEDDDSEEDEDYEDDDSEEEEDYEDDDSEEDEDYEDDDSEEDEENEDDDSEEDED